MNIDGKIDIAELERVVTEFGGSIIWSEEIAKREFTVEVAVDNQTAFEALPSHFFDDWGGDPCDVADEGDVRDFVSAIAKGNRMIASALAPRLWFSPRNQLAFDHASQRAFVL